MLIHWFITLQDCIYAPVLEGHGLLGRVILLAHSDARWRGDVDRLLDLAGRTV